MQNLMEMMLGQQSQAVDAMAKQFGLQQEQAQSAIEALLPAFSIGLKRNVADPFGAGAFVQALASGQHANYFENPMAAFTLQGVEEGNGILGHLFGSKEVSRAVAAKAEAASGVSQNILKQMLPAIASMLMGGFYNNSLQQASNAQHFGGLGGGGILGEIIKQMGGGTLGGSGQSRQPQRPTGGNNPLGGGPLGDLFEQMMGGGQRRAPQQPQAGNNPLGQLFDQLMKGPLANQPPTGSGSSNNAPNTPQFDPFGSNPMGDALKDIFGGGTKSASKQTTPSGGGLGDLFGEMFETGKRTQDTYNQGLESIFDQFNRGMGK